MNSRGYIFPTVLVFCLIFSMLAAHQLLIFIGEKQFIDAQRERMQLDAMIEKSSRDAINSIKKNKNPAGRFAFDHGVVDCVVSTGQPPSIEIKISASLRNHQTKSVVIYYNSETKSITKWVEGAS
ncbi:competence type IV pilus minor pilin ComGG [Fictibacillus sp. B-59209]|uniref:competence type IV pilus minor pilin ComGG n=1 Tax=Fictibacillus sp. B-59209 TaxID=3024873 RepID=UPI002E24CAB3|nr:competence type IV pilus minor pilin ComGG [Fictibacillus sp. B-59209]